MNKEDKKEKILQLMQSSVFVFLSTIAKDGFPHSRVMFNLRNSEVYPSLIEFFSKHQDEFIIYLATNTSSEKMKQIRANPAVCVYYYKPVEFKSLMLAGRIEVVTDPAIKKKLWQDGWEIYYPQGPSDPDYSVLRLKSHIAKGWYKDHAYELDLNEKK